MDTIISSLCTYPPNPARTAWLRPRNVPTTTVVTLAMFGLSASYANAQNDPRTLTGGLGQVKRTLGGKGAITNKSLFEIAINGINFGLSLVAVIALLTIVGGAIYYLISLGNDEKMQRAKKIVLYAILGVMVAGISFVIIETIKLVIQ
ncbi:hypothetical protein IH781_02495 [Patescibacteria group bacterium]|nr:hypothetical protein [Patescibacteria group bacterium]